jgi:type IV pilus assembly protein PilB
MSSKVSTAEETRKSAEILTREDREAERSEAERVAHKYGLAFVNLDDHEVNHELFRTIPVDLMFRYNFVPLARREGRLVIAIADPSDVLLRDELELLLHSLLKAPVESCVASHSAISDVLKKSESSQRVLEEATEDFRMNVIREDEDGETTISVDNFSSEAAPIVKLVDTTIFNAIQRRASDIHIETQNAAVVIKYRIDGVLYQAMEPIDPKFHASIISRIKVMSELDIAEKRVPQDGRFKLRIGKKTIDFRVSIMPSVHGEDAVIRVLDKESANEKFTNLTLEILGFGPELKKRFRKFIIQPYGMVLVTGPTGSGKTTTLYAALSDIYSPEEKFITIEDPVEYQLKGVTQIPVNEKKGLTFSRGLRSILRHDPDKILVGEIRDAETAAIAVQSALTGHLVFTTVHANNVVDVIGRFLNMGVEPYNFVSCLNCVLAQRLVRQICDKCKREVEATREVWEESGLPYHKYADKKLYEGAGCIDCHGTGFKGRIAVAELMGVSDDIREMILTKRSAAEIKRKSREEGMVFLREAAIEKVVEGQTTLREINKVTFVD